MLVQLIVAAIGMGMMLFFTSKPPTPPSNSALEMEKNIQYENDTGGGRNLKSELSKLYANSDYMKLLIGFAIALVMS